MGRALGLCFIFLAMTWVAACDDPADGDADADGDVDADSDGDADGDADADADADADSDADADADADADSDADSDADGEQDGGSDADVVADADSAWDGDTDGGDGGPTGAEGTFGWVHTFGGVDSVPVAGVAIDEGGNVYATGSFQTTVDLGEGPVTSEGWTDGYLVSFAPTGTFRWAVTFGSTGLDGGADVAVDSAGRVLLTGSFSNTVDLGGGDLESAGNFDVLVASFEGDGTFRWARRAGGTSYDAGNGVAINGSDDVLVTGGFIRTADFSGTSRTSAGMEDVFVASYGSDGTFQWVERFGGARSDVGRSIAVDGSGNIVVGGAFSETVDFGGGDQTSAGSLDAFVLGLTAAGAHRWDDVLGGGQLDEVEAVAMDALGNSAAVGTLVGPTSSIQHAFVVGYDGDGVLQWDDRFGTTGEETAEAVTIDPAGNLLVTGAFWGTVDFGRGDLVAAEDVPNAYVASFAPDGACRWADPYGESATGGGGGGGDAIAVNDAGAVVVAGSFGGSVDFGDGPRAAVGSSDIFLLRLD